MKKFLFILSVVILVSGLILTGCGGEEPTGPTEPTEPTEPTGPTEPYGSFTFPVTSFGDETFDTVKDSSIFRLYVSRLVFDPMTTYHGEGWDPGIAESWEISPDGLSYTFHLREGIKFHNGDDLTAEDVKYTMDRYASDEAAFGQHRSMVESVEIVDDYTVTVHTNGPQPYYIATLNVWNPCYGPILPKDYIEANGLEYFDEHPIGSGPLMYVSRVSGDSMTFEAVPNHWRQPIAFKDVTFLIVPETATQLAMFRTGELDTCQPGKDDAAALEAEGYQVGVLSIPGTLGINLYPFDPGGEDYPIYDVRVRQALSLAINRQEMIDTLYGISADFPLLPALLANVPDIDNEAMKDYADEIYRFDLDAAQDLMDDAGLSDGFDMDMYVFQTGNYQMDKVALIVQGYWEAINVHAEIVPLDIAAVWPMVIAREEMVGRAMPAGSATTPATPTDLSMFYHSCAGGVTCWWRLLYDTRPDIDALIEQALVEMDPSVRGDLIETVLVEGADAYTCLNLAYVFGLYAVGSEVYMDPDQFLYDFSHVIDYAQHAD